jgi:exosortase C (VPDSG-CTERM-specific)
MADFATNSSASTLRDGCAVGRQNRAGASSRARRLAYAGFIVVLLFAFGKPLTDLFTYAVGTDLHSHILLIPFISAYLIFIRRAELPKNYVTSARWALLSLSCGLVTLILACSFLKVDSPLSLNDHFSLMAFSFVCFLLSGGFLFLGREWMATVAFPMGFLVFMAPLPDGVLHLLERASQAASTEAAALFFGITGVPMLHDGAIFQLPSITIEVAQECSGIRSSWVLFITTLVASYLFLQSPWRRAVLIAFVIPLAIVRNGLRVWLIGFLCVELGPQIVHSIIHHRGGPLFFALSLIPLFVLLWWLRRSEQGKAEISK